MEELTIIAITQARTGSTRLPGKVLKKIGDKTLLELHLLRILKSKKIHRLIVATTTNPEDAAVVAIAKHCLVSCYQGSENDVLDRFYQSLQGQKADYIVRLTSDCPLIDANLIDKIIDYAITQKLDYCSNTLDPHYPDGQDVEVVRYSALEKAWREAKLLSEREHVTPYIWKNSTYKGGALFTSSNFQEEYSYGELRMTVDEPKDFEVITRLINDLGPDKTWLDYAKYLETNLEIKNITASIKRNEGYTNSINKE